MIILFRQKEKHHETRVFLVSAVLPAVDISFNLLHIRNNTMIIHTLTIQYSDELF